MCLYMQQQQQQQQQHQLPLSTLRCTMFQTACHMPHSSVATCPVLPPTDFSTNHRGACAAYVHSSWTAAALASPHAASPTSLAAGSSSSRACAKHVAELLGVVYKQILLICGESEVWLQFKRLDVLSF
jgi:hypothetical protein